MSIQLNLEYLLKIQYFEVDRYFCSVKSNISIFGLQPISTFMYISVMYLLQSDSESNANISTLWNYSLRIAFLLIQMNM